MPPLPGAGPQDLMVMHVDRQHLAGRPHLFRNIKRRDARAGGYIQNGGPGKQVELIQQGLRKRGRPGIVFR
jgi:hypothetical protein